MKKFILSTLVLSTLIIGCKKDNIKPIISRQVFQSITDFTTGDTLQIKGPFTYSGEVLNKVLSQPPVITSASKFDVNGNPTPLFDTLTYPGHPRQIYKYFTK